MPRLSYSLTSLNFCKLTNSCSTDFRFLNDAGNDDFIWNDDWAESLGIKTSALNDLELRLLKDLVRKIHFHIEVFNFEVEV